MDKDYKFENNSLMYLGGSVSDDLTVYIIERHGQRYIMVSASSVGYDDNYNIGPLIVPLKEFLQGLGITKNDLD